MDVHPSNGPRDDRVARDAAMQRHGVRAGPARRAHRSRSLRRDAAELRRLRHVAARRSRRLVYRLPPAAARSQPPLERQFVGRRRSMCEHILRVLDKATRHLTLTERERTVIDARRGDVWLPSPASSRQARVLCRRSRSSADTPRRSQRSFAPAETQRGGDAAAIRARPVAARLRPSRSCGFWSIDTMTTFEATAPAAAGTAKGQPR